MYSRSRPEFIFRSSVANEMIRAAPEEELKLRPGYE